MQRREYSVATTQAAFEVIETLAADRQHPCRIGLTDREFLRERLVSDSQSLLFKPYGFGYFARLSCEDSELDVGDIQRWTQWQWIVTVFFCTLAARIMTGSWIFSLVAAATLMSRGRLITEVGHISHHGSMMLILSGAFSMLAMFIRTRSAVAVYLGAIFIAISLTLEPIAAGLALFAAIPFLVMAIAVPKGQIQPPSPREGLYDADRTSLLRSYRKSFAEFVSNPELRNAALRAYGFVCAGLVLLATLSIQVKSLPSNPLSESASFGYTLGSWFLAYFDSAARSHDLHMVASFAIIIGALLLGPKRGLAGFFELTFCGLFLLIMALLMFAFADYLQIWFYRTEDVQAWLELRGSDLVLWIEPIVLSMGVCAVYHWLTWFSQSYWRRAN